MSKRRRTTGLPALDDILARRQFAGDGYATLPLPTGDTLNRIAESVRSASMASVTGRRTAGTGPGGSTHRTYARKVSRIARQRIRLLNLCPWIIDRLQGMKQEVPDRDPEDANPSFPGYYVIDKGISAGELSQLTLPLYYFDLTRSVTTPRVVGRMLIGDAGNVVFNDAPNQSNSATTLTESSWQGEKVSAIQSFTYYRQHVWYDIRMKLYGARKQAVTYDIMLVRFTKDYLVPDVNTAGAGTPDDRERSQFWQSMIRRQIVNTSLPMTSGGLEGMTVLRKARFNLPAAMSNDLDRVPANVDFKWFVKDTRVLKYQQNQSRFASDVNVDSVRWLVEDGSQGTYLQDPQHQSARTFLIVRATDMTSRIPTTDDMDNSPSFDICIRRKTRFIPTG